METVVDESGSNRGGLSEEMYDRCKGNTRNGVYSWKGSKQSRR